MNYFLYMCSLSFIMKLITAPLSLVTENQGTEIRQNTEVRYFIEKYMLTGPLVIISNDENYHRKLHFLLGSYNPAIIVNSGHARNNLVDFDRMLLAKNASYIIITDTTYMLEILIDSLRELIIQNHGRKFLVIYQNPIPREDIISTFSMLFNVNVHNLVISDTVDFITWRPYARGNKCGTILNIKKVDIFSPFLREMPLVLDGCYLNITWQYLYPSLPDPFSKTNPGCLSKYIYALGRLMNVSMAFLSNEEREDLQKGDNFTRIVDDMFERNIYLGILPFSLRPFDKRVEKSCPLMYTGTHIVLPPRKKLSSNSINGLYTGWNTLLINAILSAITFKLFYKKSIEDSIFTAIRLNLQSQVLDNAGGSYLRFSLTGLLIALIAINTLFSSVLSSILTKPLYAPRIKTFDDLLETDLKIKCHTYFLRSETRIQNRRLDAGHEEYPTLVKAFVTERNHALAVDFIDMAFFKNPEQADKITMPLYATYNIFTRKGDPVKDVIDYWIRIVFESGLHIKWMNDDARSIVQYSILKNPDFEKVALKMEHLATAFYTLAIGLLSSTLIFGAEILYMKYKQINISEDIQ